MSSSLFEEAINLQRAAHELMYLGMDGSPIVMTFPAVTVRFTA